MLSYSIPHLYQRGLQVGQVIEQLDRDGSGAFDLFEPFGRRIGGRYVFPQVLVGTIWPETPRCFFSGCGAKGSRLTLGVWGRVFTDFFRHRQGNEGKGLEGGIRVRGFVLFFFFFV